MLHPCSQDARCKMKDDMLRGVAVVAVRCRSFSLLLASLIPSMLCQSLSDDDELGICNVVCRYVYLVDVCS